MAYTDFSHLTLKMEGQELVMSIRIAFLLITLFRGALAGGTAPAALYVPDGGYNPSHHPYIPGVPTPQHHHHHRHHHRHGGHPSHHGRHHQGHPGHHSGGKIPRGATYGEYIPIGRAV